MKTWLLDLFFPPKCVFCERLLRPPETYFCENCRYELPETDRRKPVRLTKGCVAPLRYQGVVREAVLRYKFGSRPFYAAAFGPMIAAKVRDCPAELITWVPVSRRRKFSRGYDQAQLLAEETAKALGLPCVPTLSKRHTKKQSRMQDAAARRANVEGAFSLLPGADVSGKTILLIDDICTTGATMSEAALMLRTAGAAEIYGAVLAITEETKNSR